MTRSGEIAHPGTGIHRPADALGNAALTAFQPNAINVDAGFFTWEIPSGEVSGDPATFRLHGLPEQESAPMAAFLSRIPESDLAAVTQALERMTADSGTYQFQYRVVGPDGELRSMEARGRVTPGPDGRPARMVGLVMDTTMASARREAEQRRLQRQADSANRTHQFTAALAAAVTVDAIIAAAREGLDAYGANGLIMVAPRDDRLAIVASCGFDEESLAAFGDLASSLNTPLTTAIGWRAPVYLSSARALIDDYPHLAGLPGRCQQQAWAAIPVTDPRGRTGACLFAFPEGREFTAGDRAQLFAATALLAQSVERARMYESEHALARELQRGMLPRGNLTAPGMTLAVRYLPATSGLEIGGDFYDVINLSGGLVGLAIGDVQGHNLLAASLMGRLRTAVHAYAREGHGPAQVMARANRWLADLNTEPDMALFATCALVVVDPATGDIAMCRAGHPPPVQISPGGSPTVMECDGGLPLGVDAASEYVTVTMHAEPGDVLLLATDGLLENDAGDDYNLRSVFTTLEHGAGGDLESLADDLLNGPRRPPRHSDDVALLLARLDPRS
jgi:GAF domain-containing protein